jgi:hypothetical protein
MKKDSNNFVTFVIILFGLGIIVLNGIVVYQNRVIDDQRTVIRELYKYCGGK